MYAKCGILVLRFALKQVNAGRRELFLTSLFSSRVNQLLNGIRQPETRD